MALAQKPSQEPLSWSPARALASRQQRGRFLARRVHYPVRRQQPRVHCQRHHRLPAELLACDGDVRLPNLRVVGRQRAMVDDRGRTGLLEHEMSEPLTQSAAAAGGNGTEAPAEEAPVTRLLEPEPLRV